MRTLSHYTQQCYSEVPTSLNRLAFSVMTATWCQPNSLISAMFASTVEMSDEIDLKKVGNLATLLRSGEVAV